MSSGMLLFIYEAPTSLEPNNPGVKELFDPESEGTVTSNRQ